ncbi:hypothetical protein [Mitsuokella jalaludinii]|uniref:hypothetical protein n=1 Tax=Mitsuokella jalaludinii TaxID=187979 RepID=UPI003F944FBF
MESIEIGVFSLNWDWLKQAIKPFDVFIGIAAIFILYRMDFSHLLFVDEILLVTFALWFVLLLVRCYIYYQKGQGS